MLPPTAPFETCQVSSSLLLHGSWLFPCSSEGCRKKITAGRFGWLDAKITYSCISHVEATLVNIVQTVELGTETSYKDIP